MNAGIHDATNLTWKLAGVIKGWYKPQVLETYNSERRTAAQKLIEIDTSVAAAVSGNIPAKYGQPGANSDEVILRIWNENWTFTTGLGVAYGDSILTKRVASGALHPGRRAPDCLVRRPGPKLPTRLQEVMRASGLGRWSFFVFAGHPMVTKEKVSAPREALGVKDGFAERHGPALNLVTLSASPASSVWALFGGPAVGRLFFDLDGNTHTKFGFSLEVGGIGVIRPDGIFGFATTLDGLADIESYFGAFCNQM